MPKVAALCLPKEEGKGDNASAVLWASQQQQSLSLGPNKQNSKTWHTDANASCSCLNETKISSPQIAGLVVLFTAAAAAFFSFQPISVLFISCPY
jgi:hypothetical protein